MTDKPRFSVTFPEDLLRDVGKYQEANNISTRSIAIQELIRLGIDDLIKSGMDFDRPEDLLFDPSFDGKQLAYDYDKLDARGKKSIRAHMDYELSILKSDK